jgi:hypothetical protein
MLLNFTPERKMCPVCFPKHKLNITNNKKFVMKPFLHRMENNSSAKFWTWQLWGMQVIKKEKKEEEEEPHLTQVRILHFKPWWVNVPEGSTWLVSWDSETTPKTSNFYCVFKSISHCPKAWRMLLSPDCPPSGTAQAEITHVMKWLIILRPT